MSGDVCAVSRLSALKALRDRYANDVSNFSEEDSKVWVVTVVLQHAACRAALRTRQKFCECWGLVPEGRPGIRQEPDVRVKE